jgi:CysZ protein
MPTLMLAGLKALRSLGAPGMPFVLIAALLITLLALAAFFTGASTFFFWLFGAHSWLSWLGTVGSGVLAWFLFPAIMPVIVNFFDTRIVALVEAADYPALGAPRTPAAMPEFWHDVRFTLKALLLNLIALPFYLIPLVNVLLFYGLNGYLLGREFFVMVARQRMPLQKAVALHRTHRRLVTVAGISLAVAATLPIINLFAPVWGIALMTHVFHLLHGGAYTATSPVAAPALLRSRSADAE